MTRFAIQRDQRDSIRAGVRDALLHRFNPRQHKMTGQGRAFAGLSLIELARDFATASGRDTRGMSRHQIARAALHSTSDFPDVLANVANKALRDRYELAPRTFLALANRGTFPDYKERSVVQMGEAPRLQKVLEGGEYKYGTVGDAAEKYSLSKYGK